MGKTNSNSASKPFPYKIFIIIPILLLIFGIIEDVAIAYGGWYLYENKYAYDRINYNASNAAESYDIIDISMTPKERLDDFAAVYEYAVLSNPSTPEYEKLYGIDFEEMYEEYQNLIVNCEDDFDYFFLVFSFLQTNPSGHAYITVPSPQSLRKNGFQMVHFWGNEKNEDEYLYSWEQYLKESFKQYDLDNTAISNFEYHDGEYVLRYQEGATEYGDILLEIDGRKPTEYAYDSPQFFSLEYDEANQIAYRTNIMFNEKFGQEVNIKIKKRSGEIVEESAYIDEKFNFALRYKGAYDKNESFGFEDTTNQNYSIAEDDSNNLVYCKINACTGNMDTFNDEFSAALEGHDNVIIDLRGNTGGKAVYCETYLYPQLFKDEKQVTYHVEVGSNKDTVKWGKIPFNKKYYNTHVGSDKSVSFTVEDTYVGSASKDYNIYVLTDKVTLSSADRIACVLGMNDNVTLVGGATGGEGMSGMIFSGLLPESRLVMAYVPCHNTDITPDNSAYGTPVDIICPTTCEELIIKDSMEASGLNSEDYKARQSWDGTLNHVIELINNGE